MPPNCTAHNTCNVHSWLPVRKQFCFYRRRRLDFVNSLSFLLPCFWRAYYHQQAIHCLIFFCLNTHCALWLQMLGSTGTEITRGVNKRKQTKIRQVKPSEVELWSPPEGNAFLEKTDGKVLKAVSVKIKVFDCISELLRLKADCYRNVCFNVYLNDSSADFSSRKIPAAHPSSGSTA